MRKGLFYMRMRSQQKKSGSLIPYIPNLVRKQELKEKPSEKQMSV